MVSSILDSLTAPRAFNRGLSAARSRPTNITLQSVAEIRPRASTRQISILWENMDDSQTGPAMPTAVNSNSHQTRVEQLHKIAPGSLKLPVTEVTVVSDDADATAREVHQLELDLISALITAASLEDKNSITDLISGGLVSPNAHSPNGETALLAAVRAGSIPIVRDLVALGASVDLPGRSPSASGQANRTPLQLACMLGNLDLVKILVEEYRANDSWMAPDGALARQLADENGHRGIVAYLSGPSQREAPKEAKKMNNPILVPLAIIVMFIYVIPRSIFYDLPKAVWQSRHRNKSNGTPGERGTSLCQVLLEIPILFLVMVYEIPRQAILWIKRKILGSSKPGRADDQV